MHGGGIAGSRYKHAPYTNGVAVATPILDETYVVIKGWLAPLTEARFVRYGRPQLRRCHDGQDLDHVASMKWPLAEPEFDEQYQSIGACDMPYRLPSSLKIRRVAPLYGL